MAHWMHAVYLDFSGFFLFRSFSELTQRRRRFRWKFTHKETPHHTPRHHERDTWPAEAYHFGRWRRLSTERRRHDILHWRCNTKRRPAFWLPFFVSRGNRIAVARLALVRGVERVKHRQCERMFSPSLCCRQDSGGGASSALGAWCRRIGHSVTTAAVRFGLAAMFESAIAAPPHSAHGHAS